MEKKLFFEVIWPNELVTWQILFRGLAYCIDLEFCEALMITLHSC